MIKILAITEDTVSWTDSDEEEYTYPRCMFPDNLTLESKIEYCAGEFNELH